MISKRIAVSRHNGNSWFKNYPVTKTKHKRKKKRLPLPGWLSDGIADAENWCQGRIWWPRLLMLFFFMHLLVNHIKDPMYSDIFKGINLGFHEIGHMLFGPCGEFMTVAGGSLFQCLVPLLSILMFLRQRDYFGIAFCFGWLSTNLFDVAVYADDARKLALPLVTPFKGSETIHDWNYMLDKLDLMPYDYVIAGYLRAFGVISMLIFLFTGSWLVYKMMKTSKKAQPLAENSESSY